MSDVAMPAGTEMLPLIVGQIADQSNDVDIVDAEAVDIPPESKDQENALKT
jgi:hypothetical protein